MHLAVWYTGCVQPVSDQSFGPLIAYLVPGATALIGISEFSPSIARWIAPSQTLGPTLGGFLYLTVASIAVGMTISALRWATIDRLHAMTGIELPPLDFSKLGENVTAFQLLIEIHYRHYLFYSNVALSVAIAFVCYRAKHLGMSLLPYDLCFILLEVVLLAASRDTLRKYYSRTSELLGLRSNHIETGQSSKRLAQEVSSELVIPRNVNHSSASRPTKSSSDNP